VGVGEAVTPGAVVILAAFGFTTILEYVLNAKVPARVIQSIIMTAKPIKILEMLCDFVLGIDFR